RVDAAFGGDGSAGVHAEHAAQIQHELVGPAVHSTVKAASNKPTVIAASARLNTGQAPRATKSTTAPRRARSARFPAAPPIAMPSPAAVAPCGLAASTAAPMTASSAAVCGTGSAARGLYTSRTRPSAMALVMTALL